MSVVRVFSVAVAPDRPVIWKCVVSERLSDPLKVPLTSDTVIVPMVVPVAEPPRNVDADKVMPEIVTVGEVPTIVNDLGNGEFLRRLPDAVIVRGYELAGTTPLVTNVEPENRKCIVSERLSVPP